MNEMEEKVESFRLIIKKVATRIAKELPLIEKKDLEQELMLFVLSRADISSPNEGYMNRLLTGVARMYAFKERQAHYAIEAQYSYEVADVKKILETVFDKSAWVAVENGESTEDLVAEHSDVAWALDRLPQGDKEFIKECYSVSRRPPAGTAEYRKLRAVVIKLTNMLNHYVRSDEWNGPGRREVMSNNRARSVIHGVHYG